MPSYGQGGRQVIEMMIPGIHLTNQGTHTHTDRTVFINSTADAGGNELSKIYLVESVRSALFAH